MAWFKARSRRCKLVYRSPSMRSVEITLQLSIIETPPLRRRTFSTSSRTSTQQRRGPVNEKQFSNLGSAAVNEQFYTRDETGVIRRQKQRHLGNFLGFPHASHRDRGNNPRNHVCRLPVRQRRIDRTRTDNV